MKKGYSKLLIIILILVSTLGTGLSIFNVVTRPKTGYIEISKLYSSFIYKKELEMEYKNIEAKRKNILDSLKVNFEVYIRQNQRDISNGKLVKQAQLMQEQYQMKEQQFKQDNSTLSEKYTQQILNQMNEYVREFGQKYNYNYLFGATSNGTLMYAKDVENITDKVLQFINSKYQGEKNK